MNKLCAKTSPYLRARINANQPPLRLRLAARYPNNRKSSILSRLLLFAVSIAIFLPIDRNDSNPAECRIVEFSLNRSNRGNWKKQNDHKIFSILFRIETLHLSLEPFRETSLKLFPTKATRRKREDARSFVSPPRAKSRRALDSDATKRVVTNWRIIKSSLAPRHHRLPSFRR